MMSTVSSGLGFVCSERASVRRMVSAIGAGDIWGMSEDKKGGVSQDSRRQPAYRQSR